jgi:hypothetical protein
MFVFAGAGAVTPITASYALFGTVCICAFLNPRYELSEFVLFGTLKLIQY